MRRILLDTTGIYYAANAMKKIEDTHGLYSELSKSEYDALFNVVSAIEFQQSCAHFGFAG